MNTGIHRRIGTIAAVTMLVAACAGTTAAPSEGLTRAGLNKLVLTIVTGESNPEEATWFADAVAEESAGAIEVKIDNTSVPIGPTYEQDVIKYVAAGKAQLGFSAARAFDSLGATSFVGLHAPFLVDSYELEQQVLASDWAKELLGGTRSTGVVGVGYIRGPCDGRLALPANWSSCPTTTALESESGSPR